MKKEKPKKKVIRVKRDKNTVIRIDKEITSSYKLKITRSHNFLQVTGHRKSQVPTSYRSQEVTSSYKLQVTGSHKFLQVTGHKKSKVPTSYKSQEVTSSYKLQVTGSHKFLQVTSEKRSEYSKTS